MKIGLPKGLLYSNYAMFMLKYLNELEIEIVLSPDTNKKILNLGTKYCIDEACLPMKVFHGHVASLRDKCDLIVIPRIMKTETGDSICPKFCGLPETIKCDIPNLPIITTEPLYLNSEKKLYKWCKNLVSDAEKENTRIKSAFKKALYLQKHMQIKEKKFNEDTLKIFIAGHPYNTNDVYINMNLEAKLNRLKVDALKIEDVIAENEKNYIDRLKKKPYWAFLKTNFSKGIYLAENKLIDGIIYISSFGCGIDSISLELLRDELEDFPILVLKVDEQTGEAGINTRIEAFVDLLERRKKIENNIPSFR